MEAIAERPETGAWFVGQTIPGLESTVVEHVGKRQGFEVFAPAIPMRRKAFGRDTMPIFPGYVFIFMDINDPWPNWRGEHPVPWQAINNSRGMRRLLPLVCERPLPIRGNFVDSLKKRIESGEFTEGSIEEMLDAYQKGDAVKIMLGPFTDHVGKLIRYHKGSLEVLIPLLGREIPVMVPKHQVAPAPQIAA